MTKKEILKDIYAVHKDIEKCIFDIINGRVTKNEVAISNAHFHAESLLLAAQQELSFLYEYINENVKDD